MRYSNEPDVVKEKAVKDTQVHLNHAQINERIIMNRDRGRHSVRINSNNDEVSFAVYSFDFA